MGVFGEAGGDVIITVSSDGLDDECDGQYVAADFGGLVGSLWAQMRLGSLEGHAVEVGCGILPPEISQANDTHPLSHASQAWLKLILASSLIEFMS